MEVQKIVFIGIEKVWIEVLERVFMLLKTGKESGSIDSDRVKNTLGSTYKSGFWHPTQEELEAHYRLWKATPPEERLIKAELQTPWDFDSWIEAVDHAEIGLYTITVNENGAGEIKLEQYAYPSGGIEAMENLISIFGGTIVENMMI